MFSRINKAFRSDYSGYKPSLYERYNRFSGIDRFELFFCAAIFLFGAAWLFVTIANINAGVTGVAPSFIATTPEQARNAAQQMGLKDVQAGDTHMFACSQDDLIGRSFTATNINGAQVSGTVCCGLLKACTVRF